MKKICFFGTSLWSDRLTALVNQYANGGVRAVSVTLAIGCFLRRVPSLLQADVLVRVGFRPGILRLKGLLFDCLWLLIVLLNPKARQFYYWIGSDVLHTLEVQAGEPNRLRQYFFARARDRSMHLAAAPWLAGELRDVGIQANSVLFPSPLRSFLTSPELPERFAVLSYIPDQRYAFYGGEALLQVARNMPEITFNVVAGEGDWVDDLPANLHFHGWLSDMASMYMSCSVVVRLVPHDALGGTVREGLAFGRYVIYSYPIPHSIQVAYRDVDGLQRELMHLFERHRAGELLPNIAGMKFAQDNFNEQILTQNLIKELV